MAKARVVVYVRRNGLEMYADSAKEPILLPFQPEVVKNLEVLNSELVETQFLDQLETLKIKKADVIFLLADDILFTKEIAVGESEAMQTELQGFLDLVPIAPEMRVVGKKASPTAVLHFAINKALYIHFVKALRRLKYSVLAVVPTVVLPFAIENQTFGSPSFDEQTVDKVANAALQAKVENLLLQEPKVEVAQQKSVAGVSFSLEVNDKKKLVLSAIFVGLCVILFASVLFFTLRPIFSRPKPKAPAPTPVETSTTPATTTEPLAPEQTSSPVPTNQVRKTLKISIVNAGGVPGQAKQVRDLLEPLGYQDFETGNGTAGDTQAVTTIAFKPTVPAEIQTEIETAVKSLYPTAQVASAAATSFDAVITILK